MAKALRVARAGFGRKKKRKRKVAGKSRASGQSTYGSSADQGYGGQSAAGYKSMKRKGSLKGKVKPSVPTAQATKKKKK